VIDPSFQKPAVPFLIRRIGGIRIAVISTGTVSPKNPDPLKSEDFRRAYKAARADSDVLVLLDQGSIAPDSWVERDGEGMGAPDIIITTMSRKEPCTDRIVGKTHFVPTVLLAKSVGVIDISPAPDGKLQIPAKLAHLELAVREDKTVALEMAKALAELRRKDEQKWLWKTLAKRSYYDPLTCKNCHPDEHDSWGKSGHAGAVKVLAEKQQLADECLECHSEMYRQIGRIVISVDDVEGVDCGSCHSNSLSHGARYRRLVDNSTAASHVCRSCHTEDHSPLYDEKEYLRIVEHKHDRTLLRNSPTVK